MGWGCTSALVFLAAHFSLTFPYACCVPSSQVHALGLLRFILTNLSHNGMMVTLQQAIDIEARCLDALDWRLGPFFTEDDLTGVCSNEWQTVWLWMRMVRR